MVWFCFLRHWLGSEASLKKKGRWGDHKHVNTVRSARRWKGDTLASYHNQRAFQPYALCPDIRVKRRTKNTAFCLFVCPPCSSLTALKGNNIYPSISSFGTHTAATTKTRRLTNKDIQGADDSNTPLESNRTLEDIVHKLSGI